MPNYGLNLFFGSLAAFILTMTAWWVQQIFLARQERKKVRLLLRLENQRNLDALTTFWASVEYYLEPDIAYSPAMLAFEKRRAFVVEPMPEWGHLIWTTNAAKVANALRDETEISACYELHANLDKMKLPRFGALGRFW